MRRLALLLLVACEPRAPIASCTDDLAGVYEVETTATERSQARWHLLDHRRGLEAYPLFDDTAGMTGEVAPRVIDLRRAGDGLAGEVTRRYMQGSRRCDAKTAVRVTACKDDRLGLVLGDPLAPIAYEPCAWGRDAPTRVERWRRVR